MLNHLALNVIFVTSMSTVLVNANPLMKFDGYYALADFLEIPNLRTKATKFLQSAIYWHCFGIEPKEDPFMPRGRRTWFIVYSLGSMVYQLVLIVGITVFLFRWLQPYGLQNLGLIVGVVSIGKMVGGALWQGYKTLWIERNERLDMKKVGVTLSVLAVTFVLVFAVPFPWFSTSPFVIESKGSQRLMLPTAGRLEFVGVVDGGPVDAGQVIARLVDPALELQLAELEGRLSVAESEAAQKRRDLDGVGAELAEGRAASLRAQRDDMRRRLDELVVKSPSDGHFIAPPTVRDERPRDAQHKTLSQWIGQPLERGNIGAFLQRGTELGSVAPNRSEFVAVIYVDQRHRDQLAEGETLRMKFRHLPDAVHVGEILSISRHYTTQVPNSLSTKYQGTLPTTTLHDGTEETASVIYQVVVSVPEQVHHLHVGAQGEARFLSEPVSLATRALRTIEETFDLSL